MPEATKESDGVGGLNRYNIDIEILNLNQEALNPNEGSAGMGVLSYASRDLIVRALHPF